MTRMEIFWQAFAWFTLVWFASAGLFVILIQAFLPRAWHAVRANPPHGPQWAHYLWYRRNRVYAGLMLLSLVLGAIATAIFLLSPVQS